MDLKNLISDVDQFMEELQDDCQNPVKIKFLQKDLIEKQISYLEDFDDEIQQFVRDNQIEVDDLENFEYNSQKPNAEDLA